MTARAPGAPRPSRHQSARVRLSRPAAAAPPLHSRGLGRATKGSLTGHGSSCGLAERFLRPAWAPSASLVEGGPHLRQLRVQPAQVASPSKWTVPSRTNDRSAINAPGQPSGFLGGSTPHQAAGMAMSAGLLPRTRLLRGGYVLAWHRRRISSTTCSIGAVASMTTPFSGTSSFV